MITVLIGVSGSGKSTVAKKYLQLNPNAVRINRDDLRKTLFGVEQIDVEYYDRKDFRDCEKLVSEVSEQIMYDTLNKSKDIVLDNTHLQKKYIDEIIRKFNHLDAIELKFMHGDAHWEFNKFEDRLTERFNGDKTKHEYLIRQWREYQKLKKSLHGHQLFYPQTSPQIQFQQNLPKAYGFDIDGTLARKGDRDIFDDSKLHLDTEIIEVGEILRALYNSGYKIIFLSGRQDSCYLSTKRWLENSNLWMPDSEMFMRKEKDQRPDYIIKEELIVNDVYSKYNLIAMIDDRLQVSREYFRLGVFTFNVNQNLIQF